jgi:hypothetical protein
VYYFVGGAAFALPALRHLPIIRRIDWAGLNWNPVLGTEMASVFEVVAGMAGAGLLVLREASVSAGPAAGAAPAMAGSPRGTRGGERLGDAVRDPKPATRFGDALDLRRSNSPPERVRVRPSMDVSRLSSDMLF